MDPTVLLSAVATGALLQLHENRAVGVVDVNMAAGLIAGTNTLIAPAFPAVFRPVLEGAGYAAVARIGAHLTRTVFPG